MFLTPGSRASRMRISPTAGSTVAAALGPFTPFQTIYANSSNTITGMSGTVWTDATSALSVTPVSTANTFSISVSSATAFQLISTTLSPITFSVNAAERVRVQSPGLISAPNAGGISMLPTFDGGGTTPNIQAVSNDFQTGMGLARFGSGGSPKIHFGVSRGAIPTQTILQSSDGMGLILFEGSDGSFFQEGASIQASVDAAPSSSPASMPGRLAFGTTPVGTVAPVERLRITSSGLVNIGNVGPSVNINGSPPLFQLSSPSAFYGESMITTGANASFNGLSLNKTRGTVPSSHVAVVQGDLLGQIMFGGSDGTNYLQTASIRATVNSSIVGAASIPTALIFSAGSADFGWTDTLEIDQTGGVSIPAFGSLSLAGTTAKLQLLTNTTFNWHQTNIQIGNNALGTSNINTKTRGSFATAVTIVQSSDELGSYRFFGTDGVTQREAGRINFVVDAAPSSGSMPGRFSVFTSSVGSVTPVERLRIDNAGNITVEPEGFGASPLLGAVSINNNAVTGSWSFNVVEYGATGASAGLGYYKTRGTVPSSHVAVTTGDNVSEWDFYGDDGTTRQLGAMMRVTVDGAVSAGVVPLQWEFWTGQSGGTNNIRTVIDSTGRVLIGSTVDLLIDTSRSVFTVAGNATTSWGQNFLSYGNTNATTGLVFSKTRGTVASSLVIVQSSDTIGGFFCYACTGGAGFQSVGGMECRMDGINGISAPSNMFGRLEFYTNHNGPIMNERMRFDATGTLWFLRSSGSPVTPANVSGCVNETVACYNHQVYGGL